MHRLHSQLFGLQEAPGETSPGVLGEHMFQLCTTFIVLVALALCNFTHNTIKMSTRITVRNVHMAKPLHEVSHRRHEAAVSQDDIWLQAASALPTRELAPQRLGLTVWPWKVLTGLS